MDKYDKALASDYVKKFGYENRHGQYLKEIKQRARLDFQTRMLRCIASGLTTRKMSIVLKITPATCETYRIRLMKHLGARNGCQMIAIAYDRGILKPGEHYENGELKLLKAL